MRNRGAISPLSWISFSLVVFAGVLMLFQLIQFSRIWANFPPGLTIGNIPVGQLNRQQAAQRILEVYTLPIELRYNDNVVHLEPSVIGLEIDLDSMLAAADLERTRIPFWQAFWDYLWGRTNSPTNIPLRLTFSESRLRRFLAQEISPRYDQPPMPALPQAGTVNFLPGVQGTSLDIDRSIVLIENALKSNRQRTVILPLRRTNPPNPTLQNLEVLLKQTVLDIHQFDGVISVFFVDLQSGQEISFSYNNKEPVTTPPDVSFTASSTIKIPIMLSAFRRLGTGANDQPLDQETMEKLQAMIGQSNNPASDWIMKNVLNEVTGPRIVTEDMQALGLKNTFLAGYFAAGSPLLFRYQTEGNQRQDVITEPDPYSQTTAAEVGMLLEDIYICAKTGGGSLPAVFPGEITQEECQMMIQNLINDRTPALIPAGVPDGIEVAHKHGWVTDNLGVIHDMSDAAIVFTRGGDYVLSIFLYHPVQLVYEPSNALVADLSRAVYNFYNLPGQ